MSKQKFQTCAAWLRRAGHGAIDLHGKRIGHLVVLMYAGYRKKTRDIMWLCQCDCGDRAVIRSVNLVHPLNKTGKPQQSCGCGHRNAPLKHGHARGVKRSRTLISYWAMRSRCENPKAAGYEYYGGRGIRVCDRWRGQDDGFQNFLADLGPRPLGKTLDRINVNGIYEPTNCRWATKHVQDNNRRNSKKKKQVLTTDAEVAMGIKEII